MQVLAKAYGWISGAWQKQPILFGYTRVWQELVSDLNLAAGTNIVNGGAVPAGTVRVLTQITITYGGTAPFALQARLNHNASPSVLFTNAAWGTSKEIWRQGYWVLDEGDYIEGVVIGATLGDSLWVETTGFEFEINQ